MKSKELILQVTKLGKLCNTDCMTVSLLLIFVADPSRDPALLIGLLRGFPDFQLYKLSSRGQDLQAKFHAGMRFNSRK